MTRGSRLLAGIVDYAGLFPPTSWPMNRVVAEYGRRRTSDDAWMLGALVVPAARLTELAEAREDIGAGRSVGRRTAWPLSVILGPKPDRDVVALGKFVDAWPGAWRIAAAEYAPATPGMVQTVSAALPADAELFCELPWDQVPTPWMPTLRAAGARAKLRTGGVKPRLVPPIDAVARFLQSCAEGGVGMKFTAGLHHPVRSEQPLTYADDAPRAVVHGFLNVFVAAALLARDGVDGVREVTLHSVLAEDDPSAFTLRDDGGVTWRDDVLTGDDVESARATFARSFGSCSFSEPLNELRTLELT